jgi:hypothetical protein
MAEEAGRRRLTGLIESYELQARDAEERAAVIREALVRDHVPADMTAARRRAARKPTRPGISKRPDEVTARPARKKKTGHEPGRDSRG